MLRIERGQPAPTSGAKADRRLYLSAEKDRVVEEGDPASAYLLAPIGQEIPASEMVRLGLSLRDGRIVATGSEPEPSTSGADPEPPATSSEPAPSTEPEKPRGGKSSKKSK
jgi:hypothetical protein